MCVISRTRLKGFHYVSQIVMGTMPEIFMTDSGQSYFWNSPLSAWGLILVMVIDVGTLPTPPIALLDLTLVTLSNEMNGESLKSPNWILHWEDRVALFLLHTVESTSLHYVRKKDRVLNRWLLWFCIVVRTPERWLFLQFNFPDCFEAVLLVR